MRIQFQYCYKKNSKRINYKKKKKKNERRSIKCKPDNNNNNIIQVDLWYASAKRDFKEKYLFIIAGLKKFKGTKIKE